MMNRFFEAFHALNAWVKLHNLGPFEVVIRFRNPQDAFRAADCLARDADPLAQSLQGAATKGRVMDIPFSLEHAGLHSPHEVAEALRRLAGDVDEAARPIPLPPLPSALSKAFRADGDVVGQF